MKRLFLLLISRNFWRWVWCWLWHGGHDLGYSQKLNTPYCRRCELVPLWHEFRKSGDL